MQSSDSAPVRLRGPPVVRPTTPSPAPKTRLRQTRSARVGAQTWDRRERSMDLRQPQPTTRAAHAPNERRRESRRWQETAAPQTTTRRLRRCPGPELRGTCRDTPNSNPRSADPDPGRRCTRERGRGARRTCDSPFSRSLSMVGSPAPHRKLNRGKGQGWPIERSSTTVR